MPTPSAQQRYIPALSYSWLTRFYDPVLRWTVREETFKKRLIEQARIKPGNRILDLGCGTGTLTTMLKRLCPSADVVGVDGDPEALDMARAKSARFEAAITFEQAMAWELPYASDSFDLVVSSLLFHHLSRTDKNQTLVETTRVLRPGGQLFIADWGKASNLLMRLAFLNVQLLDGFATTTDNVDGLLPRLMADSGFHAVQEFDRYSTIFGSISLLSAKTPE